MIENTKAKNGSWNETKLVALGFFLAILPSYFNSAAALLGQFISSITSHSESSPRIIEDAMSLMTILFTNLCLIYVPLSAIFMLALLFLTFRKWYRDNIDGWVVIIAVCGVAISIWWCHFLYALFLSWSFLK